MTQLRPSQIEGKSFLAARRRAFLADDTGLGKSAQSISAADEIGAKRIIVLCQAIGRLSWALEIPKFQTIPRTVVQFDGATKALPDGPMALVVAYSSLSIKKHRDRLFRLLDADTSRFGAVIIDEAHHLSNPESNRTEAVYGRALGLLGGLLVRANAPLPPVWLLSATFQRKNAGDMYAHLRALFPDVLWDLFGGTVPDPDTFVEKFCITRETHYGLDVVGNNPIMIDELRDAVRPHLLRRVKKDVAQELGEVQRVVLPFEVDQAKVRADVLKEGGVPGELDTILDGLDMDSDMPDLPPSAATERRVLGVHKLPPAIEWIEDFLDADPSRKLVVFAHHVEVLLRLEQALKRFAPAVVHGSVNTSKRAADVNRFQTMSDCRLFIGQTIAAGTSITLTAASTVLLLEAEGVPADDYQAISRVHRIGQTEPVTAYYAFAAGTADEKIVTRARRRADDFEHFIGALTTTN